MSISRAQRGRLPSNNAGTLLREWRTVRRMSQLELALDAEISTRHLSCVETGKAQPSRDMIVRLAEALSMPLRERNTLLAAAGFAPSYPETALGTAELAQIRRAIDLILEQQEPYPAFVLNRHWDIVQTNRAALRVGDFLIGGSVHNNMVRQFFDPLDMRRVVANWEEIAGDLLKHLHDTLSSTPFDIKARALLNEALRYPGVPSQWKNPEFSAAAPPILTVEFRKGNEVLRFFSTITTFATSRDVTVEELRIECAFPADEATAERCRALAGDQGSAR